jgi:hypothetical protein
MNPFVSFEELRKLNDEDLVAIIDKFLTPPDQVGINKSLLVDREKAHFFIAELDRRHEERAQDRRDAIELRRWTIDFVGEACVI